MAKDKSGPFKKVTNKGSSVSIYHTPSKKGDKTYDSYTLIYTQAGTRSRKTAATLAKAVSAAKAIAEQLSEGTGHVVALTPSEVADYTAALRILHKYPTVSLTSVCQQFVDATDKLDGYGTLADAVQTYLAAKKKAKLPDITVSKLADNFMIAKEKEGLSHYYLKDIKRKLKRFSDAFRCNISSISAQEIKVWVTKQGTGRNANNLLSCVSTLFSYAKDAGFLPQNERHAAEQIRKVNERPSAIGIYTPSEIKRILDATDPSMVPTIAIAAFAGLRSAEIFRLDWSNIKMDRQHISLDAEKAKTATRRIVPILPNLSAWLAPHVKKSGRVTPDFQNLDNLTRKFSAICASVGVKQKRNGFRHSFASYRMATEKSAPAVALEMGNSPKKLFTNYRELVTEDEGKEWFDVAPESSGASPQKKRQPGQASRAKTRTRPKLKKRDTDVQEDQTTLE